MNDIKITLTNLTVPDINAILAALQELPAKVCNPLTQRIQKEAQQQVEQFQKPVEETE